MSEATYVIYGKDNCPNCNKAETILKMKGARFSKLMLDKDYSVTDLQTVAGEPIRMLPYILRINSGGSHTKLGAGETGIRNLLDALRV